MPSDRVIQALALTTAVACLLAAGFLAGPLQREQHSWRHTTAAEAPSDALPPHITVAITALGPLRALGIDYLWLRATDLQQQGKFFEANQLSQWITSLQPRFWQVWQFHAWNMAYNISVATHTPDERWDWVNKGIALLRDKGIAYNPTAVPLYRELSWIYFHKIGQLLDDMHWYYKRRLALDWQELLGAPTDSATTPQAIDRFRAIPQAPDSLEDLLAHHPDAQPLIDRLHALGYQLDETLLRQIGRAQMYRASVDAGLLPADFKQTRFPLDRRLAAAVFESDPDAALEPLLAFLRKRVLRTRYHMDPRFMLELMETYGPLDWRHPAAHGCYWSEMGLRVAAQQRTTPPQPIDLLNTNRQVIYSLQHLAWSGLVYFDPVSLRLDLLPDPRFIPAYDRAMDQAKQRIESGLYGGISTESFAAGHENFLLRAMTDYYLYGDPDQAQRFYDKARQLYANRPENLSTGRYRKPLSELVTELLQENLQALPDTRQFITAMILRAMNEGLANGRRDTFDRFLQLAHTAHQQYQHGKERTPLAPQDRRALLPFQQVLEDNYIMLMKTPSVSLLKRARIWANTPPRLQLAVYARLLPDLTQQAQLVGIDPRKAFPAPPGLAIQQDLAPPAFDLSQNTPHQPQPLPPEVQRR